MGCLLGEVVTMDIDIDDLVKDCSNSSVLAMELLQSCTKPSIWFFHNFFGYVKVTQMVDLPETNNSFTHVIVKKAEA